MRIGRSRSRAASMAASLALPALLHQAARELDDQDRVLGRQSDRGQQPDLK
jgi:hypothetical protein